MAPDGEAAWNETLKRMPDLVVSDVAMPKVDGLELCKRIKTSEITGHIPVLLLTANALDDDQRIEGYEYGAEAYVTKPFNGKVLLSRIENLLTTRRLLKGHSPAMKWKRYKPPMLMRNLWRSSKQPCAPSWPIPN